MFQPLMFENIVMETLHMLREMATNGESEEKKVNWCFCVGTKNK